MNNESKWIKYGKLLPGLIHNLNTPLMGVSGRVELLQMKMGEDKSLTQIMTQLDKINQMLSSVAYLLDKDQYNQELEIELNVFLEHYFAFLYADSRFKHQVQKEQHFEPASVTINPSDLIYILHTIIIYLLDFIDEETSLLASSKAENGAKVIDIYMTLAHDVSATFDLNKLIKEQLSSELGNTYEVTHNESDNQINVKIKIKG